MRDPAIAAALKSTGVVYSHNNMSVVGDNEMEKIRAEEATAYVRSRCVDNDTLDTSQPTITTINYLEPSSNYTSSFPINQPKTLPGYEDILNRVHNPTKYDEFKTLTVTNFTEPIKPLHLYFENQQSEADTQRQLELEKQRQLQRERKKRKIQKSPEEEELPILSVAQPPTPVPTPTNSLKRKIDLSDEISLIEEKPSTNVKLQRQLQQQRKSLIKVQTSPTPQTFYYPSPLTLPPLSQILNQSNTPYSFPQKQPSKTNIDNPLDPIQQHSSKTINFVDITGDN